MASNPRGSGMGTLKFVPIGPGSQARAEFDGHSSAGPTPVASCQAQFAPQQCTAPSLVSAQLCAVSAPPTSPPPVWTSTTSGGNPETSIGVLESFQSGPPSWPCVPVPQHLTPVAVTAQVWFARVATVLASDTRATWVGALTQSPRGQVS